MRTQVEKGQVFRALHQRVGAFIIPNPWDEAFVPDHTSGSRLLVHAVPAWERAHMEIKRLLPDGDPDCLRSNLDTISLIGSPIGRESFRHIHPSDIEGLSGDSPVPARV